MARFYASIRGNRGEATRMGTPNSGIRGHVRGWNVGARVDVDANPDRPADDVVTIIRTSGSNGYGGSPCLEIFESHNPEEPDVIVLADTDAMVEAARELLDRHIDD